MFHALPYGRFVALPHLQFFKLDFSDLFSKTPKLTAWSAVLAYSLVMIFDIGKEATTRSAGAQYGAAPAGPTGHTTWLQRH